MSLGLARTLGEPNRPKWFLTLTLAEKRITQMELLSTSPEIAVKIQSPTCDRAKKFRRISICAKDVR